MRLPNQRSLARLKRFDWPVIWLALIFLAGCASGTSGMTRVSDYFKGASPSPSPTAAPPLTATPAPAASPVASEPEGHPGKKTVKQARAASENAAVAAKEAANASAAAALASKQAASVANQIQGSGPSNADVSLESNPAPAAASTPLGAVGNRATPASSPSLTAADARDAKMTPTLSSPALESSGQPEESDPAKAAKLIQSVDRVEKRVDRKNLTADDSQRDILAQRLLQEANRALAGRDSVAAISLATKASTLLEPLPKLADSSIPPAP
jgi:hypothetical protein